MESTKKIKELENETQELKFKVSSLDEKLKNIETPVNKKRDFSLYGLTDLLFETIDKLIGKGPSETNRNNNDLTALAPIYNDTSPTLLADPKNQPEVTEIPTNENNTDENVQIVKSIKQSKTESIESTISAEPTKPDESIKFTKSTKFAESTELNESWVGTILMDALASFLIFIALITFAKLLSPYITDTVKIIVMYSSSITMTMTGFVYNKKKPKNTFYIALLACGSSCIYISILVAGIYFKAVSSMKMYIQIGIWAGLIIFLKRTKNGWLFFAIGNFGYLVSIFFTIEIDSKNDVSLIIPILIYVVMIGLVYQITYWKNKKQRYTQNFINILFLFIFQIITMSNFNKITEVFIVEIVVIAYAFINFVMYSLIDLFNCKKVYFYVAGANAEAFLLSYILFVHYNNFKSPVVSIFISNIIIAIVLELKGMYWDNKGVVLKKYLRNVIWSTILFVKAALILICNDNFIFYSGILLVAHSLIVVYGIIKKSTVFKLQGWFLVVLFMIEYPESNFSFIIIATLLSLLSLFVEGFVLNDSESYKIASYFASLLWIMRIGIYIYIQQKSSNKNYIIITEQIIKVLIYGIMALLHIILYLVKFYKTKGNDKGKINQNIRFVFDILNLVYMYHGICMMNSQSINREMKRILPEIMVLSRSDMNILKIIYEAIVFVIAGINTPLNIPVNISVKDIGADMGAEIIYHYIYNNIYLYTFIKFAILLCSSLWAFKTPSIIISVYMITYAMVCIILGFRYKFMVQYITILKRKQ